MSAVNAHKQLASAATAAAEALSTSAPASLVPTEKPEKLEKPGLRLPGGQRVLDYCRDKYIHQLAGWADESSLDGMDIVPLEMDVGPNDDEYYLIHEPGTRDCAIIWPSHGGAGNCAWRLQEVKFDGVIEAFMRSHNAWTDNARRRLRAKRDQA